MESDTLYRITGINRLTGVREPISLPLPLDRCLEIKQRALSVKPSLRPYTRLKVEPYQTDIFSKAK